MLSRRSFLTRTVATGALFGLGASTARTATENSARKQAKNIIFMVADGMNPASLHATRHFQKLALGKENTWLSLYDSRPAVRSMIETSSASGIVTDSSAASSCWGSGHRVKNGTVNISPDGKPLETLLVKAKKRGMATGLVTTATATHATPAGFVANTKNRRDESIIARQYLERRVDIILGGGTKFFDAKLCNEFKSAGYKIILSRDGLLAQPAAFAPLLGLFAESHLPYTINRDNDPALQATAPTLAEMASLALRRLGAVSGGFILQIEGARVDHAAHGNDAASLIRDMLAFDDAIVVALDFVDKNPDTLLVITTDHGTGGFNINGTGSGYANSTKAFLRLADFTKSYSQMRRDVRGLSSGTLAEYLKKVTGLRLVGTDLYNAAVALDAVKALPSNLRPDVTRQPPVPLQNVFGPHTSIGWTSGNHTGDLVELAALGPGAERFKTFLRNDEIHGLLLAALGEAKVRK
ncbi:MAG: alkaline phosphatase [Puniceicoccales bacterium]|jgi:alkaline phosphatase|nr:alkaline phosphatase [Puniceicoccales bacterium]